MGENENGTGCPRQQKKCAANKVVPKLCSEKTRRDGSEESETRRKILKMGVGAHGSKTRCAAMRREILNMGLGAHGSKKRLCRSHLVVQEPTPKPVPPLSLLSFPLCLDHLNG